MQRSGIGTFAAFHLISDGKHEVNEDMKMKAIFPLLLTISVAVGCNSPRCGSEYGVQKSLLRATPLGSSPQQVMNYIIEKEYLSSGYTDQPAHDRGPTGYTVTLGAKSIGPVDVGWFWTSVPGTPANIHISASWAFEDDKLIAILVHREADGS